MFITVAYAMGIFSLSAEIQGHKFLESENCYSRSAKGKLQGNSSGVSKEFTTGTVLFSKINVLFCTGQSEGEERVQGSFITPVRKV